MEIQRKIVESKNPPSNREVWWFDTNTEVLKRHTGGAWVQVTDSARFEYDDSGTVIETTYKEAEALYESGNMIPGVKYQFEYKHNVHGNVGSDMIGIKNEFPIQVYIDRNGQLKAIGSYTLDEIKRDFIADFSFEDVIIFIDTGDDILHDSMIYDQPYNITIAAWETMSIDCLTEFLINNNINYSSETSEDEFGKFIDFTFTLSKSFSIYLDRGLGVQYICLPNGTGIQIDYGTDYQNSISHIEGTISITGLHNLDFGTFKHSHVIEGYFYNNSNDSLLIPSIVKANVHNNTFIPFVVLVNISDGDIINTTFKYSGQFELSDQADVYIIDDIYTNNNDIELVCNTQGEDISIPSLIMNTLDENNPYKFAYGDTIVVDRPAEEYNN